MKHPITLLLFLFSSFLFSQTPPNIEPHGGGEYIFPNSNQKCLTEDQRASIIQRLDESINKLTQAGILNSNFDNAPSVVAFDWPLQKTSGLTFNGYYGISNYVDHDPSGGLEDYNCDARTYNGHNGTDMFTWPFPWYMVDNDYVEVIAGEAGTIILKDDGNDDDHCSFIGSWNAVYIQHADGSIVWYGHMKKNSVTAKAVGQTVTKGEYLGVVASSGFSTGPHLHMEVYEGTPYNAANRIDPYQGTCNSYNGTTSWWASQQPNRVSTLNALLTHDAVPSMGCPGVNEVPNFSNTFDPGDTGYFAIYFRDQMVGDMTTLRIRRPDNSVWQSWSQTSPNTYNASWWYWNWILPTGNVGGTWKFEVDYNGNTFSHDFTVTGLLPVELTNFSVRLIDENDALLKWTTTSEIDNAYFAIQHSINGIHFESLGKVVGKGNSTEVNNYQFTHYYPNSGINYYRLRQVDFDNEENFSEIKTLEINDQHSSTQIFPNPANDILHIKGNVQPNTKIEIIDNWGRVLQINSLLNEQINVENLSEGLYYLKIINGDDVEFKRFVKQ